MAANSSDKLTKAKDLFSTTLNAGVNDSTATIPLNSVSGLPTDTAVILTIDAVDSQGNDTPSLREVVKGVVSGGNLTTTTRGVEGTAQSHSSGAVVTQVPTAKWTNDMVDWGTAGHQEDGDHAFGINYDTNNNESFEFSAVASAINHLKSVNAATGNNARLSAAGTGSGANRGIEFDDSNSNELLKLLAVASAVNELTVTNAASGSGPIIGATGSGTDIDINATPKGAGKFVATGLKSKGLFVNTVSKSNADSPYSITVTDDHVLYSTSSGASTATLPTAASVAGRTIRITKTSSDANLLTIGRTSSQTINGVNSDDFLLSTGDFVEYVSDGSNWFIVSEKRLPIASLTAGGDTTSSTSYTDLAGGANPSATAAIGVTGIARVTMSSSLSNNTSGNGLQVALAVSGGTTLAANDNYSFGTILATGTQVEYHSASFIVTGLTPGSNVFTAKYKVGGGTGTATNRRISVEPK